MKLKVMVTVTRLVPKDADTSDSIYLSADIIGRTNPEGVRQSSADSELRRCYDKKIKKIGRGTKVFRHLMSYFSQRENHGTLQQIEYFDWAPTTMSILNSNFLVIYSENRICLGGCMGGSPPASVGGGGSEKSGQWGVFQELPPR